MSIDLCFGLALSLAGQTITQIEQPVQSSGATWMVYFIPLNSLFEDNAEFGFGYRLAIDKNQEQGHELLRKMASQIGERLVDEIVTADQTTEAGLAAQRLRVLDLRKQLATIPSFEARWLEKI